MSTNQLSMLLGIIMLHAAFTAHNTVPIILAWILAAIFIVNTMIDNE